MRGSHSMGTLFIVLLLALGALPCAVWFACEASAACLNPWRWALLGIVSIIAPTVLFGALTRVLRHWTLLPEHGWPSSGIVSVSTIALGWLIAALIYKRILKPRREAIMGTSLNYIGGWLGTLICVLLASAIGSLVFYGLTVHNRLEYYCPGEYTWSVILSCGRLFAAELFGTVLTIVSVILCVSCSTYAASALVWKLSYAVRMTGYLLLWFGLLNLVDLQAELPSFVTNGEQHAHWLFLKEQIRPVATPNLLASIGWLVYLIKSKRIREVYGHNFGEQTK